MLDPKYLVAQVVNETVKWAVVSLGIALSVGISVGILVSLYFI